MASAECEIQVYVRRTGEMVSIKAIPSCTKFGEILTNVCQKMNISERNNYYLALNYEIELEDNMVFELKHQHDKFQMLMRAKPLIEFIAGKELERQQLLNEAIRAKVLKTPSSVVTEDTQLETIDNTTNETAEESPLTTNVEKKKFILGDVVQSTIEKIPRRDIQNYLHKTAGKGFDIVLMGSPRVGKSTLINAILKKDLAETSAGRNACTTDIASYTYEESYTTVTEDNRTIESICSIRIWDAPGIEDWTKFDVAKHLHDLLQKANPICLIYCASPGAYTELDHVKAVLKECKKMDLFVAMIVTNMYASDEADVILTIFKEMLAQHHVQTKVEGHVFYYGNVGLCTEVNSAEYKVCGKIMPPTGIDELMFGIMNSLSGDKMLQWCFALMNNGPFWVRLQALAWKLASNIKSWFDS